ncbi:MAG: DUF4239 domain-containing protein [Anaerolineae bacterium]
MTRLPTLLLILPGVGASVLFAVAGVYAARRFVPSELLKDHNDVAGNIYAMLGVVYAVLLAFIVLVVWQQYQNVDRAVDNEANAVIALYRVAQGLPDPTRTQLEADIRAYTQAVIDDEWSHLGNYEQGLLPETALARLWATGMAFEPHTTRESDLYTQVLEKTQDLSTLRRERFQADRTHIPDILWVLLLGGGMIIVVFTFFFGTTNGHIHALMASALAAVIAFTLLLIFALDHPFAGSVRIGPDAFRTALALMQALGR